MLLLAYAQMVIGGLVAGVGSILIRRARSIRSGLFLLVAGGIWMWLSFFALVMS